jgi:hypothetical protein
MTSVLQEQHVPRSPAPLALADMRVRFPARVVTAGWPATTANREETLGRLTCAPFVSDSAGAQKERVLGLKSLLDWLEDQPGDAGRTGGWPAEPTSPAESGGRRQRAGCTAAASIPVRGWGGCRRPC